MCVQGDVERRRRMEAGAGCECRVTDGVRVTGKYGELRGTRRRTTKLVCVQGDGGKKRRMEAGTGCVCRVMGEGGECG